MQFICFKFDSNVSDMIIIFQIPIVADLPVGQNLHDHPDVYMTYTVRQTIPHVIAKIFNPETILQYTTSRSGKSLKVSYSFEVRSLN